MITKICTDIEQSKLLAEILPKESADVCYTNQSYKGLHYVEPFELCPKPPIHVEEVLDGTFCGWRQFWQIIPAWSLSTLLSMIPVSIEYKDRWHRLRMDKGLSDFSIWYDILDSGIASDIDVTAKDPVDACFEMILKLNELKLL